MTLAVREPPPPALARPREGGRAAPPYCVWRRTGKGAAAWGNDKIAKGNWRRRSGRDALLQGPGAGRRRGASVELPASGEATRGRVEARHVA